MKGISVPQLTTAWRGTHATSDHRYFTFKLETIETVKGFGSK